MHRLRDSFRIARSAHFPWRVYLAGLVLIFVLYWLFPSNLLVLTRIATLAILVMSLDLVTGYAGLPTLGHAAMYGMGAYCAALCAKFLTGSPLVGLFVGAASGAVLALVAGSFLVRYRGLAFLMLTIAVVQIMQSVASKLSFITGGDDGLSGFSMSPVLGRFEFDMFGVTGYWYSMILLLVSFIVLKRIVSSPFGLCCTGIRENRDRMSANGTRIYPQLLKVYVLAGFFAGLAGAITAQVNQIVGLDSLGFELSAEALVMLVLGGAGNLVGGIVGAAVFGGIHHLAATANPFHWLFAIGVLLMAVVFLPKGAIQMLVRRLGGNFLAVFGRRT